jgi:ADP-ribose pyrophosphatase
MRQYRYTVKDWCWEIPMGARNHEDLEVVARQELLEEVGGVTNDLRYIATFYANNGVSDIRCAVFLALEVELGANHPEPGELIEVVLKPAEEVMRMARAGEITDGVSALALFLCEPYFPVSG